MAAMSSKAAAFPSSFARCARKCARTAAARRDSRHARVERSSLPRTIRACASNPEAVMSSGRPAMAACATSATRTQRDASAMVP
eukprot:scaffold190982_cov21-Tisochrysis_lutea.AAC.1